MCRKFQPWPGTQAHRNLRVNENRRCQGWSNKEWAKFSTLRRELQTVNFYMTEKTVQKINLDGSWFFRALAMKSPSKTKNTIAIGEASLHFFETKEILCRHILITVSPPYFLSPSPCSLRQRPKTTNNIIKSQACAKTAFFKEDVFDLGFPNSTYFFIFLIFVVW